MKRPTDPAAPLALTRLYALTSLIGVVVTAIALALLFRGLSIRVLTEFGEQSNVAVARTVLNGLYPELVESLQREVPSAGTQGVDAVPPHLPTLVHALVQDTPVERIKLFDGDGIVLYSSSPFEIGTDEGANPLIREALRGKVGSRLDYRDTFSLFTRSDEDENLIETYVPVLDRDTHNPIGVLEIYTSIDTVAAAMARNELVIILGIAAILVVLYGSLLYVVRRSESIIARQRQTILERNHTLEVLSARLLATEDNERRRIATELHEDIAQTLCAAKVRAEAMTRTDGRAPGDVTADPTRDIVPLVTQAIGDVRALAMDLRPSALDDFGLLATARELCREAKTRDPGLRVSADFSVQEDDVPAPLKGIIFRILQETIKRMAPSADAAPGSLRIALGAHGDSLELSADLDQGRGPVPDRATEPLAYAPQIAAVWERAVLSGAALDTIRTATGSIRYRATWTKS